MSGGCQATDKSYGPTVVAVTLRGGDDTVRVCAQ